MLPIEDGRRVKTWRLTGNLNQNLTETITHKTVPDIDMQTKVSVRYTEVVEKLENILRQNILLEH